jgi:hypothetical protein
MRFHVLFLLSYQENAEILDSEAPTIPASLLTNHNHAKLSATCSCISGLVQFLRLLC